MIKERARLFSNADNEAIYQVWHMCVVREFAVSAMLHRWKILSAFAYVLNVILTFRRKIVVLNIRQLAKIIVPRQSVFTQMYRPIFGFPKTRNPNIDRVVLRLTAIPYREIHFNIARVYLLKRVNSRSSRLLFGPVERRYRAHFLNLIRNSKQRFNLSHSRVIIFLTTWKIFMHRTRLCFKRKKGAIP